MHAYLYCNQPPLRVREKQVIRVSSTNWVIKREARPDIRAGSWVGLVYLSPLRSACSIQAYASLTTLLYVLEIEFVLLRPLVLKVALRAATEMRPRVLLELGIANKHRTQNEEQVLLACRIARHKCAAVCCERLN